jgi:hypothetical protein
MTDAPYSRLRYYVLPCIAVYMVVAWRSVGEDK